MAESIKLTENQKNYLRIQGVIAVVDRARTWNWPGLASTYLRLRFCTA